MFETFRTIIIQGAAFLLGSWSVIGLGNLIVELITRKKYKKEIEYENIIDEKNKEIIKLENSYAELNKLLENSNLQYDSVVKRYNELKKFSDSIDIK